MKGAGMKKASELLDAIAGEADDEAANYVTSAQASLKRQDHEDVRRYHASATALLAVARILNRTAQKERQNGN
jgi:hypothetical protein